MTHILIRYMRSGCNFGLLGLDPSPHSTLLSIFILRQLRAIYPGISEHNTLYDGRLSLLLVQSYQILFVHFVKQS